MTRYLFHPVLLCLAMLLPAGRVAAEIPAPVAIENPSPVIPFEQLGGKGEYMKFKARLGGVEIGRIEFWDRGQAERESRQVRSLDVYAGTMGVVNLAFKGERFYRCFINLDGSPWQLEEYDAAAEPWEKLTMLDFDRPHENRATRYEYDDKPDDVEYPPGTLDPGAAVMRWRGVQLQPGQTYHLTVLEGKTVYDLTFTPRRGPRLRSILGLRKTLLVEPRVLEDGKPFKMWSASVLFTDSPPYIPIQAKVQIYGIGLFNIVLDSYLPPGSPKRRSTQP